jgi:hypothetical protein
METFYSTIGECITFYSTIDECIMAAYNHVKETNSKVEFTPNLVKASERMVSDIGLKSSDGHYFMITLENNYQMKNRTLFDLISDNNITIVDVINKQLLAFL